jgi:hypothetical protein
MRLALASFVLLAASTAAAEESTKIAVVPTQLESSAKGMVPDLFDDYLLTAVQNTSQAQVIGQDDIGAMLGFEKQKDLMNCDDTSCMADIGGALGVDKIVSVKVARLGEDWVATAKLINIKTTRVEARVNEIVAGDTKALLQAVPRLIAKLFGKAAPDAGMDTRPVSQAPRPSTVVPTSPGVPVPLAPNPQLGRGSRVVGTILMLGGTAIALYGGYTATEPDQICDSSYDYYDYSYDTECEDDTSDIVLGGILLVAGIVSTGVGAKQRANGAARAETGNVRAGGSPGAYWLGWLLGGFAMASPFLGVAELLDEDTTEMFGWVTGIGSLATFLIGGFLSNSTSGMSALPVSPTVGLARDAGDDLLPTFGFGTEL